MNNRIALWLLATLFLATVSLSDAQQTGKFFRIGSIASGSAVFLAAFRQEMSKLGWIEGKNIAIEYRYAEGKRDRFPELAAELVRLKVDIILVAAGATTRAAKNATKTIPIVMAGVPVDPVEAGLVESLARPGDDVTGLTSLSRELAGKRLELLKEAVPKGARIAALYETDNQAQCNRG